MIVNPFKRMPQTPGESQSQRSTQEGACDPLDVEDLLIDGSKRATITEDGTLVPKDEALQTRREYIELMKQREWGIDTTRLQREQELMAKKFPKFQLRETTKALSCHGWDIAGERQFYWLGKLRTHSLQIYTVMLTYPDNYPYEQIPCFVIDPYIPKTEHRYLDGHLCLYSNDHGGRGQGWDSASTTAVSYVAWTAAWLHAYEIWLKTRQWPYLARFR